MSSLLQKLSLVAIAKALSSILQALALLILAALMEPVEFGAASFIIAIAATTSVFARVGLNYTVTLSRAKGELEVADAAGWSAMVLSGLVSVVVAFAFDSLFVAPLTVAMTSFTIGQYDALGRRAFNAYGLNAVLKGGLLVTLAPLGYELDGIDGLLLGMTAANLLAGMRAVRGLGVLPARSTFEALFSSGFTVLLQNFLVDASTNLSRRVDKILVGVLFGPCVLGLYQFNLNILFGLELLPVTLQQLALVDRDKAQGNVSQVRWLLVGVSLLISISAATFLPSAVATFFPAYSAAVLSLQLAVFVLPFLTFTAVLSSQLQRQGSRVVGYVAILRILMLLSLLWPLGHIWALEGMSVAVIAATLIQAIGLQILAARVATGAGKADPSSGTAENVFKS